MNYYRNDKQNVTIFICFIITIFDDIVILKHFNGT